MNSSADDRPPGRANNVRVTKEHLWVDLSDGRVVSVPLDWYPRLAVASDEERANWALVGRGEGIHWPDLDEDISVQNLLSGDRSAESRSSFERWLASRGTAA